jgi:hypothetical protein
MADNAYLVGQGVTLEFDLTVNNAPADDVTTVTVTDPQNVVSHPTVVEGPTGVFKSTLTVDKAGLWWYSAASSTNVAVGAGSLIVNDLIQAPDATSLCDLLSAREFVLGTQTDDTQDKRLVRLINGYSRAIYKFTHREWLPQSNGITRSFPYDGSGVLDVDPFDLRSVSAVTLYTDLPTASQQVLIAPSSSAEGDWRLEPAAATLEGTYLRLAFSGVLVHPVNTALWPSYGTSQYWQQQLDHRAQVTGNWGIASDLSGVPDDVQLACLVAVADAYRNPEGYPTRSIGPLTLTEEAAVSPTGQEFGPRDLPGEARALLEPYCARQIELA